MVRPVNPTDHSIHKGLPEPLATARGGVLDWPAQAGISREFRAQVENRRRQIRKRRRAFGMASGAVIAAVACALWVVPYFRDTATVATGTAQRRDFALADGSHAQLNARTVVRTDFRHGRRIVTLEHGEAFFSVAKDPEHPFLVETPAGTVRVLGTEFNVRVADSGHLDVTLLEGSVAIDSAGPVKLAPGEQFQSQERVIRRLLPAEIENVVAWRDGRIAFDGLTLAEAAARLGAYHGCQITVAPAIANLEPGGSIPISDLKAVLHALESALEIRVIANADGSYRLVGV